MSGNEISSSPNEEFDLAKWKDSRPDFSTQDAAACWGVSVAVFKSLALRLSVKPSGTYKTGYYKTEGFLWNKEAIRELRDAPAVAEAREDSERRVQRKKMTVLWNSYRKQEGIDCSCPWYGCECYCPCHRWKSRFDNARR